ncbi:MULTISPECIES: hypothetical protein [Kordiimonas]|jgi:hypothetical protein|uniref:hypothetical protein n=1 Tax=Kordiimonas TaxID=288021 RepID=UPI00257B90AC|nr:hypothetical protein [Kordiimonas sp. UBA4487]
MSYVGAVWADTSTHLIYFVVAKDFLYVGETGTNPVIRWAAHLASNGTLRQRIRAKGDDDVCYLGRPIFLSFDISSFVETLPKPQAKSARQAVEYSAQCVLMARPSILPVSLRVISNVRKSCPVRFPGWVRAQEVAEDVCHSFAERLKSLAASQHLDLFAH